MKYSHLLSVLSVCVLTSVAFAGKKKGGGTPPPHQHPEVLALAEAYKAAEAAYQDAKTKADAERQRLNEIRRSRPKSGAKSPELEAAEQAWRQAREATDRVKDEQLRSCRDPRYHEARNAVRQLERVVKRLKDRGATSEDVVAATKKLFAAQQALRAIEEKLLKENEPYQASLAAIEKAKAEVVSLRKNQSGRSPELEAYKTSVAEATGAYQKAESEVRALRRKRDEARSRGLEAYRLAEEQYLLAQRTMQSQKAGKGGKGGKGGKKNMLNRKGPNKKNKKNKKRGHK